MHARVLSTWPAMLLHCTGTMAALVCTGTPSMIRTLQATLRLASLSCGNCLVDGRLSGGAELCLLVPRWMQPAETTYDIDRQLVNASDRDRRCQIERLAGTQKYRPPLSSSSRELLRLCIRRFLPDADASRQAGNASLCLATGHGHHNAGVPRCQGQCPSPGPPSEQLARYRHLPCRAQWKRLLCYSHELRSWELGLDDGGYQSFWLPLAVASEEETKGKTVPARIDEKERYSTALTVSYATEVTAFAEKGKLKKITGVKTKELMLWLSVVEVYVPDASRLAPSFAKRLSGIS
ncbi:hypothetical protein PR202_ga28598 [Eleusine coracana subsp. coracana]|uniref:Uncharacterized protein n=1 Tax=Eleusine coracana subsp. coracana TaxID=191504 RepID=A0AAV5DJU2_ELECO|nr:hypothetical protein PR202_ga28598 [Eleusine coracana subsp. coracana]